MVLATCCSNSSLDRINVVSSKRLTDICVVVIVVVAAGCCCGHRCRCHRHCLRCVVVVVVITATVIVVVEVPSDALLVLAVVGCCCRMVIDFSFVSTAIDKSDLSENSRSNFPLIAVLYRVAQWTPYNK